MPSERSASFYNMLHSNIPIILKLQYQVQILSSNLFCYRYHFINWFVWCFSSSRDECCCPGCCPYGNLCRSQSLLRSWGLSQVNSYRIQMILEDRYVFTSCIHLYWCVNINKTNWCLCQCCITYESNGSQCCRSPSPNGLSFIANIKKLLLKMYYEYT